MRVHLVNPSDVSFGVAIITPRWLYVLAAATPPMWGDPILTDETLEVFDPAQVEAGDVVGIGIHTANALRGYQVGRLAREQGAFVVYGGIHATLYPDEETHELGGAHAVVRGDGDSAWATVLEEVRPGGTKASLRGRARRGDGFAAGPVEPHAARSLYVGIGADSSRLSETLLVLLRVAHRRSGAASTNS